jgi:hypothetical protein
MHITHKVCGVNLVVPDLTCKPPSAPSNGSEPGCAPWVLPRCRGRNETRPWDLQGLVAFPG